MNYNLAIINGHVIDPANNISEKLNVFIKNGLISKINSEEPPEDLTAIDATGKIVAPGFIDLHTHLREPGQEYKEDIATGTKAAAAGGFTTIFCMPNTDPVNDCVEVTRRIKKRVSEFSQVEVYPVSAISLGLEGRELVDLFALAKEGVIAISDDGSSIQNRELMKKAMEIAKDIDLLVISHPEDHKISKDGVMNDGSPAKKLGMKGIPKEAENKIIERDIKLAGETGARLHVAHVSTAEGIELVRRGKNDGLKVSCEVTPHHLMLTEDACADLDPNTKMNPPLRTEIDRQALIEGLIDGTVDAIATDHAPHANYEKKEFRTAPFGVIGMETAFPVCMELVRKNQITLERLIELFTSGPARVVRSSHSRERGNPVNLNALDPRSPIGVEDKFHGDDLTGSLSISNKADITIIDINQEYKIDPSKFLSKSRNTPFSGRPVYGKVFYTVAGGKIVYKI